MNLASHNYGKQRVRVLKVLRSLSAQGATAGAGIGSHQVKELEVGVRLEGDFGAALISADNSVVVATDTIKNTVQVLAHRHLGVETEPFAALVARHFLDKYEQIVRVTVDLRERAWRRMSFDGQPHEHAFSAEGHSPVVRVVARKRGSCLIESGVEDLLILKSTGSGFVGFPRDEYTTLPETKDRILATILNARWRWSDLPGDPSQQNARILDVMLRLFAERYSPSVQATMWDMAQAAFDACSLIDEITLALPNKHYLPANLAPFGLDGSGVSFVPTDEPHGQIEATMVRGR